MPEVGPEIRFAIQTKTKFVKLHEFIFVLQFFAFSEWMFVSFLSHRFWMTASGVTGTIFSMLFPSAIFWRMDF